MKITLKVKDTKVAFFLELITALGFVEIKSTEPDTLDQALLSEEEKNKIEKRLAAAKENNFQGQSIEQVNQHLVKKYGI